MSTMLVSSLTSMIPPSSRFSRNHNSKETIGKGSLWLKPAYSTVPNTSGVVGSCTSSVVNINFVVMLTSMYMSTADWRFWYVERFGGQQLLHHPWGEDSCQMDRP